MMLHHIYTSNYLNTLGIIMITSMWYCHEKMNFSALLKSSTVYC